ADYSADLAGIALFEHLQSAPQRLDALADGGFRIPRYVPLCAEFDAKRPQAPPPGAAADALRAEILTEIRALPGYTDK
ncbi:MAG: hypothetical protein KF861_16040, partial [Planctomycetaceae bacterium]|nr:hypothetical protein [Planctomycetaceae bacterium]